MRVLLRDLWRARPVRLASLVLLIAVTSCLEGCGLAALLPLVMYLSSGRLDPAHPVSRRFADLLTAMHLPVESWSIALLVLAIFASQYFMLTLQSWVYAFTVADFLVDLRERLFRGIISARWPFFVETKVAQMCNVVVDESYRVYVALCVLLQLLGSTASASVYLVISLLLSWKLSLLMLAMAGVIGVATQRLVRRGRAVGADGMRFGEELVGWTAETITGAKLIKATGAEQLARDRFHRINAHLRAFFLWINFQPGLLRSILELSAIATLVVGMVASRQIFHVDLATLLVVLGIFVRLYPRLSAVQIGLQSFNVNIAALDGIRALEARAAAAFEDGSTGGIELASVEPVRIELAGVSVSYGEHKALRDISLTIEKGRSTAIVGGSGAGKTTLVDCLLGLLRPDAGRVLVDDRELAEISLQSWRGHVGYVGQETILFNATIAANIAWTHADASHETIEAAARSANAHDFIAALPRGYETPVGDRGVRLSGGQRQRIGLARALVGGRSLLVLDEATSALDSLSEDEVMQALARLRGKVTILMVAHRLSTIRGADAIITLDRGQVVERGTWDELLARKGRFEQLWAMQTRASGSDAP